MSKPLALTQRQVVAICEGAKKAKFVPLIEIGGAVIKLIPEDHADTKPTGRVDEKKGIRL